MSTSPDPFVVVARAVYGKARCDMPKPPQPPPFRDRGEAQAALTAWLTDGAEILLRCRVGRERGYLLDTLTEFAGLTLAELDEYWGIERWDDSGHTREWAAEVIRETDARLRGRA
jgi:hypothetical protein